eukprot:5341045-Heterocapsa_arctica.AAC.1
MTSTGDKQPRRAHAASSASAPPLAAPPLPGLGGLTDMQILVLIIEHTIKVTPELAAFSPDNIVR